MIRNFPSSRSLSSFSALNHNVRFTAPGIYSFIPPFYSTYMSCTAILQLANGFECSSYIDGESVSIVIVMAHFVSGTVSGNEKSSKPSNLYFPIDITRKQKNIKLKTIQILL